MLMSTFHRQFFFSEINLNKGKLKKFRGEMGNAGHQGNSGHLIFLSQINVLAFKHVAAPMLTHF